MSQPLNPKLQFLEPPVHAVQAPCAIPRSSHRLLLEFRSRQIVLERLNDVLLQSFALMDIITFSFGDLPNFVFEPAGIFQKFDGASFVFPFLHGIDQDSIHRFRFEFIRDSRRSRSQVLWLQCWPVKARFFDLRSDSLARQRMSRWFTCSIRTASSPF